MNEARAIEIAENADMILNGYAVTCDEASNFKVINLYTGKAAYIVNQGMLSETNMDEVESAIACRIVNENRQFLER